MRRPPFESYFVWPIIGTISAAIGTLSVGSLGLWWLAPLFVLAQAPGWYFAACSTWYRGQSKVMGGDLS